MGESKNPAKKAAAKKTAAPRTKVLPESLAVSDASAFKKLAEGQIIKLPSGLVIKAKRVELQTFILTGNVPNQLMSVVSEALEKGQKANIPEMMGMDEGKVDLDQVRDMYDMVNQVCETSFVEPTLYPLPDAGVERHQSLLYIDEVVDEDKMFIFQWATGGTADVETFRREARTDLDALAEMQGHKKPAKRAAGNR